MGAPEQETCNWAGRERWVKECWAEVQVLLYSLTSHISPAPRQDFRVGLQSPSLEAREAKGSNVPGSQ